jgi:hypothetical protein
VTSRLERSTRPAAFLVPATAALLGAGAHPDWAEDLSILRSLGGLPVDLEGLISAALGGALSLVPVGSPLTRIASANAIALGFVGWLIYRLSRRVSPYPTGSALDSVLALVAALCATLGPSFLGAGTHAGGAATATALSLATLDVASSGRRRAAVFTGALLAATACESRPTAFAVLVVLGVLGVWRGCAPNTRSTLAFLCGAGCVLLLPAALAAGVAASPGRSLGELFPSANAVSAGDTWRTNLDAVLRSSGWFLSVLGATGILVGVRARATRALSLGLLTAVLIALFVPSRSPAPTDPSRWAGAHLLGLSAIAVAAGAGLHAAVEALIRARLPLARPASALLVVYGVSLVFVATEDSARAAERQEHALAQRWTDEALLSLPPKSLLLLRSETISRRLLAARALGGLRPDLLVVPTAALHRSSVRLDLVEQEAALVPIVRDVLLAGKPSELALTGLADARPMFVELDPNWDARLYPHLVPRAFFSEFAPHPLGRSDRSLGIESGSDRLDELLRALAGSSASDAATREILASALAERAVVLEALGDRTAAARVTDELLELAPGDSVGRSLRARFAQKTRGALDVRALLASR